MTQAQTEHTLLPGMVRDVLRRINHSERRLLIGQVLQVLADESVYMGKDNRPKKNLFPKPGVIEGQWE